MGSYNTGPFKMNLSEFNARNGITLVTSDPRDPTSLSSYAETPRMTNKIMMINVIMWSYSGSQIK